MVTRKRTGLARAPRGRPNVSSPFLLRPFSRVKRREALRQADQAVQLHAHNVRAPRRAPGRRPAHGARRTLRDRCGAMAPDAVGEPLLRATIPTDRGTIPR